MDKNRNLYWLNYEVIEKRLMNLTVLKKLKEGEFYLLILNVYIFIQVFSESQLNEMAIIGDILYGLRIILLCILAVQAFLFIDWKNIRYLTVCKIFAFLFALFCIINTCFRNGGQNLLGLFLLVVVSRGKSLKKILKNTLVSMCLSHGIVLGLCLCGILYDDVAVRWIGNQTGAFFSGEYVRHAFGFLHSNQLPLAFMLMVFLYVAVRAEKFTVAETILIAVINYLLFDFCGSRISLILVVAFLLCLWYIRNCPKSIRQKTNWIVIGYFVYPFAFIISLVSAYAYRESGGFWDYLNLIFNNRLIYAHKLLNVYPFSFLGYGKYAGTYNGLGEATADNGYVVMLLQAGFILSIMIILLHEYIMHICIKKKCTILVLCLSFVAIENLINAHMPSYKLLPLYCILVNSHDVFLDSSKWLNRKKTWRFR